MKNLRLCFLPGLFYLIMTNLDAQTIIPDYKNPEKSIEQRVNDILRLMTLEEKADFLAGVDFWHFKGIARLGIPSIQVTDCGHGVTIILDNEGNWVGNATCFPTAAAQAATWNRSLICEVGSALGRETRATGSAILLAPMVNIKRHPLNGRNYELFSEDPFLAGKMATAFINGVQSEHIGAVIKAFTANNQQMFQSDLIVEMDERTLQEIYLPNFRIPVAEAEPWGVMTAYNGLNGFRTSANKHLLTEILKEDWNYKGFVVSDWRAVKGIESVYAGLDIEMPGPGKFLTKENILVSISEKSLTISDLDDKVKRILRALVKTRLLDDKLPDFNSEINSERHRMLARKVAEEGIVLLKNKNSVLPLSHSIKKLAVIGPNATEPRLGGGGSASVSPFYAVSPLEGIKMLCGADMEILYEEGCGLSGNLEAIDDKYLRTSQNGKIVPGLTGEYFSNPGLKGSSVCTFTDAQVNFSWGWANPKPEIGKEGYSVRWKGQLIPPVNGEYVLGISAAACGYRLFIDGKLLIDQWLSDDGDNFEAEFTTLSKNVRLNLEKDKLVNVQIEFYKRTNRNFIRFEWEIPGSNSIESAKEVAKNSDAVIIFAGLSNFFEGGNNDRHDIILPGQQNFLINEVAKVNSRIVVVLINGSALAMPWIDDVSAVLEAYYPGQEGGNAIASVLFGITNPSGKLPETFPVKLSDNPAYGIYPGDGKIISYNEGIFTGYRHYDFRNIEPLFPFGHGLSYTTFRYSDLKIIKNDSDFDISFIIKNTGTREGAEVAQLYIRDVVSSDQRPLKELKNFEKIFLNAGESKMLTFKIIEEDLSYFSEGLKKWITEPGEFEILIGSSSRDIRLKGGFVFQ